MSAYCEHIEKDASYPWQCNNMPIDEIKTLVESIHTEETPLYIS